MGRHRTSDDVIDEGRDYRTFVDREAGSVRPFDSLREVILELAVLDVRPGQTESFEEAFAKGKAVLSQVHGFRGLELQRCIEAPNRYIMLVRWDRLEDHTVGFPQTPQFEEWSSLVKDVLEPSSTATHHELIAEVSAPA